MFKKVVKNLILCLMMVLSSYIISACCGPKMCEITVKFNDVDESLGLSNYTETIEAGYGVTVTIDIPIGYVYDNFSARVGDYNLDWTVKVSDPTIEPEYEYTVARTITVKIDRVNSDHDIDIDMSGVRIKKLKVNVAQDILDNSITEDKDKNRYSNLKIVTLNPDYLSNLMYLKGDAITGQHNVSVLGEAYIEYGQYAILCYTKDNLHDEMPTIYGSVGKFTPESKIIQYKDKFYAEYNMSVKGNVPYNIYDGNLPVANSRLYYMGQIKEDFDLYKDIPDFEIIKGVTFEEKENQFVLLTNKQEHNSSLLSLSFYTPTMASYDATNELLDKVDGQTIVKLDKYDGEGEFKNTNVYSQYGTRYDMISMYIGDMMATDSFLTEDEKNSLSNSLYLVVDSELPIGRLDIGLLSYEKQKLSDFPMLKLTEFVESQKGKSVYKLDKELLKDFIKERVDTSTNTEYLLGSAFLDITFSEELRDENWRSKEFTTIMFPIELNGQTVDYDNEYQVEVFVEDDEGNRDYGLVDRHSSSSDVAIFKSSQIYDVEGDGTITARNDFYISIKGPDYNDYYSPVIETMFLYKPYGVTLVGQYGLKVEDPKEYNGVEKYRINLGMQINNIDNSTYIGQSLRLRIALSITTRNTGSFNMDFSNITFADQYNDAIYMTNSIDFTTMEDFKRIDNLTSKDETNVKFGYYADIYYFVYSTDENLEFDIYVGQLNEDTKDYYGQFGHNRIISGTKELRDILGNVISIRDNMGQWHVVYTKYQNCHVYRVQGGEHFAYNPNEYCHECDTKLVTGICPSCTNN